MVEYLLKVENLGLKRNDREILKNVNLIVKPGKVHGLLGLNGSGKSSLAYAIMGCSGYEPTEGRIIFEGKDIIRLPINERARLGITLAWQEPARFEGLPVSVYLALGAKEKKQEVFEKALDAVALSPKAYIKRTVDKTLSGGERKRIELAGVYLMQPKLAILDEPDSGIDMPSIKDVISIVKAISEQGSSVLLITHSDEMLEAVDSASLMCRGTIIYHGNPADVRAYYDERCLAHSNTMGPQPWEKELKGY